MTSPHTIISVKPYGLQRSAPHSVGDYTRVWRPEEGKFHWKPSWRLAGYHIIIQNFSLFCGVTGQFSTWCYHPAHCKEGCRLQAGFVHMAGSWYHSLGSLLIQGTGAIMGPHPHSSHSHYLPKAPPPKTITLDIRASTYEIGGRHKYSVHCSPQYLFDEEMKENPHTGLTVLIKNNNKK